MFSGSLQPMWSPGSDWHHWHSGLYIGEAVEEEEGKGGGGGGGGRIHGSN